MLSIQNPGVSGTVPAIELPKYPTRHGEASDRLGDFTRKPYPRASPGSPEPRLHQGWTDRRQIDRSIEQVFVRVDRAY